MIIKNKTKSKKTKSKILIIGYHGTRNIGAEARLKILSDFFDKKINYEVISLERRIPGFPHVKQIIVNPFFMIFEFFFLIKKHDIILIDEGGPFADFQSKVWFFYWMYVIFISKIIFKKQLIITSVNIGKMNKPDIFIFKQLIKKVDYISFRNLSSLQFAKKIGIKNLAYSPDIAVLLKPEKTKLSKNIKETIKKKSKKKKIIGITIKDFFEFPIKIKLLGKKEDLVVYPFYHCPTRKNRERHDVFVDEIVKYIKKVTEEFFVVLLNFEMKDDNKLYDEIEQKINCPKNVIKINTQNFSPGEVKDIISIFDIYITGRFHPNILSFDYNIPLIGIHTEDKIFMLFKDCKLPYLVKCDSKNLSKKLLAKTNSIKKNKNKIKTLIKNKNLFYKKEVKKELKRLFSKIKRAELQVLTKE